MTEMLISISNLLGQRTAAFEELELTLSDLPHAVTRMPGPEVLYSTNFCASCQHIFSQSKSTRKSPSQH